MATAIQFRRGTTAQHANFTGLVGEITVDTDLSTIRVHDGSTAGGTRLAKYSEIVALGTGDITAVNTTAGSGLTGGSATGNVDLAINYESLTGNLVPSANNTYSLGSTTNYWKDVYVGPGSLYVNGQKVIEDNSGTIQFTADSGQNISILTVGGGDIELNAGTADIQLKSNVTLAAGKTFTGTGGFTLTSNLNVNSQYINNLTDPVAAQDAATKNYVDTTASIVRVTGDQSIAGNKTFSNNIVVSGNLTVSGTTTTVNSETISLADNIIDLNSNFTSGDPTEDAGIKIKRGDSADVQIKWNETSDVWQFTNDGSTYQSMLTDSTARTLVSATDAGGDGSFAYNSSTGVFTYTGPSAAEVRAHFSGGTGITITNGSIATNDAAIVHDNLSGFVANEHIDHSAVTITAGSGLTGGGTIAATRTLNVGAGTGITVNADDVAVNSSYILSLFSAGGDLAYNSSTGVFSFTNDAGDIEGVTAGSYLTGGGTTGTVTLNVDATDANTASKVVARDASGNFSAGTITAALTGNVTGDVSGNAGTATKLATARTIALTGDVTGSASFDGSANASITATIAANSVALGTDTTGNYVGTITAGTGLSSTGATTGENIDHTLSLAASGVTAATYGTASTLPAIAVDTYGRITSASNVNIDHDALTNFVANEHIDHSAVTITAGSGLTGGGTIAATRTLNVGAGTGITVNADDVAVNATYIKNLFSASDAGGDGSFSYNSGTGAFTYTGPSAAEVRAHFSAGTGVTISSGQISIGQAVGTASDVTFNNMTVSGNLTVSGTTTTVNTETVNIADNQIVLNSNYTGSEPTENGGIEIERGTLANKSFVWDETADKWTVGSETMVAGTFEGALTGNVTGDVSGNAGTATKLATARTISLTGDVTGSASFDGSAAASITATIAANSVALGTDTTGNYVGTITAGTGLSSTGATTGEGVAHTLSLAASGVTAATYGTSSTLPAITVDAYGRITAASNTNIDHDALTNFVANEHIDHSAVSITAGNGLTGGGTIAATRTLAVGAGAGITVNATNVALTSGVVTAGSSTGGISAITVDTYGRVTSVTGSAGYSTTNGTVTSVGGTGSVNGITLSGTVTASGSLTLGGSLSGITVAQLAGAAVQTGAEAFADSDTVLMTAAAIQDKITSYGYSTTTGTVTSVSGGTGLTGTVTTSGSLSLATSGVTAGTYGTATVVPQFTVDAYGRITGVSNVTISGDITAVTAGSYLTGGGTSGAVTLNVDATTTATASKVVARDSSGDIYANLFQGTATAARYADLAERYEADTILEAGTVVCFGGEKEVTACDHENDHRVAGVISTDPAYMMNSAAGNNDTHPYVALTGRVPVKVVGPVAKGDLMVASSVKGHAKADNNAKAGTIIGKAIGSIDSGEGVIEVLVNMM